MKRFTYFLDHSLLDIALIASLLLIVIAFLFLKSCAYMPARYNTTGDWKKDAATRVGTYTPEQAYMSQKMREDVARDGYHTNREQHLTAEYISDASTYIAEKDIEYALLQQIKEAIENKKYDEAQDLQRQLDVFRESQTYSNDSVGNRRHMLRLNVVNTSENYVVRFSDPPFHVVGELGPGETSDRLVEILEGSHRVQYMEKRLDNNHTRWEENSYELFIEKGRTKPIEIYGK